MSIQFKQRLPDPTIPWVDVRTGKPTVTFYQYMRELDDVQRKIATTTQGVSFLSLPPADTAIGETRFVTNGRKVGEGGGAGTGTLAYSDGTAWRAVATDATVAV